MKLLLIALFLPMSAFAAYFPTIEIKAENPFNGIQYEQVKVGKTNLYNRFRTKYYWRYITVYNVKTHVQRVQDVPSFEENCHDSGNRVASWEFTRGYERTISTGASFDLLGFLGVDLGGEISRSFEISITRWIQAVQGVHALHTPFMKSYKYEGMTYKQIYYPKTGEIKNYTLPSDEFLVDYIKPVFKVERQIIGECF